jgi:hypothetical protein
LRIRSDDDDDDDDDDGDDDDDDDDDDDEGNSNDKTLTLVLGPFVSVRIRDGFLLPQHDHRSVRTVLAGMSRHSSSWGVVVM